MIATSRLSIREKSRAEPLTFNSTHCSCTSHCCHLSGRNLPTACRTKKRCLHVAWLIVLSFTCNDASLLIKRLPRDGRRLLSITKQHAKSWVAFTCYSSESTHSKLNLVASKLTW